jgi:hypothetical protein
MTPDCPYHYRHLYSIYASTLAYNYLSIGARDAYIT